MSAHFARTAHGPAVESVRVERWRNGESVADHDAAAAEVPVCLEFNGLSHAVMLASPTDLEDFALGFSLTEGIIDRPGDLLDMEEETSCEGIVLRLTVAAASFHRLKQVRRNMAGRTGCGLCGAESLSQVFRPIAPLKGGGAISAPALHAAFRDLSASQPLMRLTGATHAAGWALPDGALALIREDVGRHNALDKLIGAMAREGIDPAKGAAMVTSRASYEMVQKSAAAGIAILAAISAPTALAIRMADSLNLTLVGFARGGGHVLYAGTGRILAGDPS
ncbi:Formate dehydrogenase chain D [Paramagnetospirillum magnetotacticum MS-1]|uniref:Sulfur carrier protein FdhD n=1 Tax=Paramagnetospirillum magnetotacticum MS-1 TaxID=272627 RepID=A0A0C2YKL8_PARME|nr:formate dehydrogenase accessory sulfurtransferase FdhD [Paramagnetospirillum magnetotacticum]KIM00340.1 Formate dehydrogenase chain D [Paramagnetospirillum magnetotacticum MS-1]